MTGSAALYQVAVALIPALLFGGAVLELRDQPRQPGNRRMIGLGVSVILAAGVVAEIIAIRGAIDPAVGDWERRYLVLVLTAGTAGLAIWIAAPLLRAATTGTGPWLGWRAVGIVMILTAVGGQLAITESLEHASARVALEDASKELTRASNELNDSERSESRARTQLISLARSVSRHDAVVAVVLSHLRRLDDRALHPIRSAAPHEGLEAPRLVDPAIKVLNSIDLSLQRKFGDKIAGLRRDERELLLLAQRRLFSAVASAIVSRAEFLSAEIRYRWLVRRRPSWAAPQ